jgi:hypothetical protein
MPGWKDLVICGKTPGPDVNADYIHPCGWNDIIQLISHVITDLVILSTYIVVVACVYSGFKLLMARGKPGELESVKNMFMKILIGYFWVLVAWVLIYTIVSKLAPSTSLLTP